MKSIEAAVASLGEAAQRYAHPMEMAMIEGHITAPLEKAHFLAQVAYESSNFTRVEENLFYTADRLRAVFPKYFKDNTITQTYHRQPAKIANHVYANRLGNGNEASGDGYKYRGRGPIQLTGKENYRLASEAIFSDDRLVTAPDLVSEPYIGCKVAVWFWNSRNCCGPSRRDDCEGVTRLVNGGLNGLDGRKELLAKFKQLFT
jgi:putative chitinase